MCWVLQCPGCSGCSDHTILSILWTHSVRAMPPQDLCSSWNILPLGISQDPFSLPVGLDSAVTLRIRPSLTTIEKSNPLTFPGPTPLCFVFPFGTYYLTHCVSVCATVPTIGHVSVVTVTPVAVESATSTSSYPLCTQRRTP